jgi:TnpA family transposase
MKNTQRLQILPEQEVLAIYSRPIFNEVEHRHYFSLSNKELSLVNLRPTNGKDTSSKLYFILQLGYFKAKHLFFQFNYIDVKDDTSFILNTYMPNDIVPTKLPTRKVQITTRFNILSLIGFQDNTEETNQFIIEKLNHIVQKTVNPIEIFHELKNTLEKNKIVLPPYSRLQDAIGSALRYEESRVIKILQDNLTPPVEQSLKKLLEIENSLYKITELKFDAKTFRTQEMQLELSKLETCQTIYLFSQKILPILAISRKNIGYYSDLAKIYTIFRLRRLKAGLAYLYLICYVHKRYEKIVNNLTQGFAYYVDKYNVAAKKYSTDNMPDTNETINRYKKKAGELIGWYADDNIMQCSGSSIQEKAYTVMAKEDILTLSKALLEDNRSSITTLIWEYHKNNYRCILLNLRPLFQAIDFETNSKLEPLQKAINYLKSIFKQDKKLCDMELKNIPLQHIYPKSLVNEFFKTNSKNQKIINIYQYEFYIYNLIRYNLKTGRVFINNSLEYKNFDEDINISPTWAQDQENILKKLDNPVLLAPIENTLISLQDQLEPLIVRVNERILSGENKHVKVKYHRDGTRSWTVPYPKRNDETNNPFYDNVEPITISEAFDFVERRFKFIRAFTHIKPHYSKSKQDFLGIKAVILANGTTQGTYEFSKRSNLKYQRLQTIEQNNIRLETLRNAAQIIIDGISELPIFSGYNLNDQQHGSVDGKKKKTRIRVLKSRHSPKYFGLDIGVVIMTMNLNHVPFVTNIKGANEHESHFTYSMLMENLTAIDPAIISTDTAGTNNVNDFLYYLIGKTHAACYRSTADKAETISGFKPVSSYDEEYLIKPKTQVNKSLITKKWPELVPILVSLLSHETSQDIVVAKLSSHEYKNDIKDALWELNNILKSIHILKYIDDPEYRRNIRTALNRGEAYHQLLDKITGVGIGDFRGMSELEVEIWNECTRLIALIIIAYNMCILSELYEIKLAQGDIAAINFLKYISPIASQHLNLGGLYEFSEDMADISINEVVDALNKILDASLKKE